MTQQTFVVFVAKIIMVQAPLNKFAWESIHKINFANFSFIQKFIRAPITIWKQVQKRAKNGELYPLSLAEKSMGLLCIAAKRTFISTEFI